MTHRCSKCDEVKSADCFYGRNRVCKTCWKAKAFLQRDEKREYLRNWRAQNPDAHKQWYARNKQRKAEYWKRWYSQHKDHRSQSYARWAEANKHIVNALIQRRAVAKRHAVPAWADHQAIKAVYARAARLTATTGIRHEVDHIFPLRSKWVCGLHCEANLQVLTKADNARKGNRPVAVAA